MTDEARGDDVDDGVLDVPEHLSLISPVRTPFAGRSLLSEHRQHVAAERRHAGGAGVEHLAGR